MPARRIKPRGLDKKIVDGFMAGASFYDLQEVLDTDLDTIESAIRKAMNRKTKKR